MSGHKPCDVESEQGNEQDSEKNTLQQIELDSMYYLDEQDCKAALRSSIMKFIRAYVDDLQQQSRKGKKKDEEDKKKANEFRDKPMETLKRKSSPSGSDNSDGGGAAGPSASNFRPFTSCKTPPYHMLSDKASTYLIAAE
ncbi:unnamed protein product, partial [Porites evermanni]